MKPQPSIPLQAPVLVMGVGPSKVRVWSPRYFHHFFLRPRFLWQIPLPRQGLEHTKSLDYLAQKSGNYSQLDGKPLPTVSNSLQELPVLLRPPRG